MLSAPMLRDSDITSGTRHRNLPSQQRCSVYVGVSALAVIVIYTIATMADNDLVSHEAIGNVWSVFAQLLLFVWWFGLDLMVWEKVGIQSASLLDLSAPTLNSFQMLNLASILSTVLAGMVLLHKIASGTDVNSPYPFVFALLVWFLVFFMIAEAWPQWARKSPSGAPKDKGCLVVKRLLRWHK